MKNLLTLTRYSDTIIGIEFCGNDDYENFHSLEFDAEIDGNRVFIEFCDELKSAHKKAIVESIAEQYGKGMIVIFEEDSSFDPATYHDSEFDYRCYLNGGN